MKKKTLSRQVVEFILIQDMVTLSTLTPERLALHWGVELSQLLVEFQKDHKIPLDRFIIREKMHRAALHLESVNYPHITELAQTLGFVNIADFIQEFENYLAVTPERYWQLKHMESTD